MAASKQTLSSRSTIYYKFLFPAVWLSVGGTAMVGLWSFAGQGADGKDVPTAVKCVGLGMWAGGLAFVLWFCAGLKKVRRDGESLYVSNYRREITVPFSEIVSVTENLWLNPIQVTVHFRTPTEFGRKVTFMPELFWMWMSHPVVAELRNAAGLPVHPCA